MRADSAGRLPKAWRTGPIRLHALPPHPRPLPQGEGEGAALTYGAARQSARLGLAEGDDVARQRVQFVVGDASLVEPGHGADAGAGLGADGGLGERLVIQRGADAGAAAGVALVAVVHE